MEYLECSICGIQFGRCYANYHKWQQEPYNCCSEECFFEYCRKNNELKKCKLCGKLFAPNHNKRAQFCSNECRKNFYYKFQKPINDAKYDAKKEVTYFDIFVRDNFTCQYCGKTPNDGVKLVVDHIYPVSKGGESDSFNLITSCNVCNGKKYNKLLPIQLILDLWSRNQKSFTYEQAKKFFEDNLKHRKKRLRHKSIIHA